MAQRDTLDKVIGTYFRCMADEPYTYKNKTYHPKKLRVSPLVFRGFTCPPNCGGCCPRFSLDYLPGEELPPGLNLVERFIEISGRRVRVLSDMQEENTDYHCKNLSTDARCGIHGMQPFSCDFELLRFIETSDDERPNGLMVRLFGRGWAMRRQDGERGALCGIVEPNEQTTADNIRKLKRLKRWMEHFGVKHRVDAIIAWMEKGPSDEPLIVPVSYRDEISL